MEYNQAEQQYEIQRLEETKDLAKKQLRKLELRNEKNLAEIIEAKKELRENTSHAIGGLWSSEGFEALAELNQYANPVEDKIAACEENEVKMKVMENMIKSPYFARIDFRFDGEDTFEKIYIGRSSLIDEKTHEMHVYDWRSPIAGVFYRFLTGKVFYDAPSGRIAGEVNLKRQYEINNGKLEYFFDADVQIVDEFLRQILSKNTSSKMKAIVETIQGEQDTVIRDMENDLMMVQGVAGSGKTSVALHRAAYLMYQGLSEKLNANNIMIISPNSLFEQYISDVLPQLGEHNVMSAVFDDLLSDILRRMNAQLQRRNRFLERLLTSERFHDLMKRSLEYKTSRRFTALLNRFIEDIPEKWIEFEDIVYKGEPVVSRETLKRKIQGRTETPVGIKLEQLEKFILESVSGSPKKRIGRTERELIRQEVQKFTKIDLLELYRRLFSDKQYLHSLAESQEECDAIDEICQFTQENLRTGYICYDDAIVLAYLQLKIYGSNRYRNIRQAVIDEAQDYYPMQFEIFRLLFPFSRFTVLGDTNQTLLKREDMSLYDQIRRILNKEKSTLITMDKSFRCTNEILSYSLKFIDCRPEIKSFNRSGEKPRLHIADSSMALREMAAAEIECCKAKGYRSIGLLCKSEKNARSLYEAFGGAPYAELIVNEKCTDLHGVFILPVYLSKGLEFDAVLICDADRETYYSDDDKNLLYIACTRALHRLSLFCSGQPSPLL